MHLLRREAPLLVLLALIFTLGLTFASLELPYLVDELLQQIITTPGWDSHAAPAQRLKTEIFIEHFHLRTIGYLSFAVTVVLIIAGFATKKTSLAALGALAFMLPVFAQFAAVMFFLAGLGILNLLWLPVLDVSFDTHHLGLIIRAPYDVVAWMFRQLGLNIFWETVYLAIGGGLLVFFLGTFAWLSARARNQNVADFWIYRISRHPQYLGWILWTYGLFLLQMLGHYPKRSWGIDASLPWLLSTMVIVGVAMLEELHMVRRHGQEYDAYRRRVPFLLPLPPFVITVLRWPQRLLFGKERPERPAEIAAVVLLYTLLLVAMSALFYGGGLDRIARAVRSEQAQKQAIEAVYVELKESEPSRARYFIAGRLAAFGRESIPYFVELLEKGDAGLRQEPANRLGELGTQESIPSLVRALRDPDGNIRYHAIGSLEEIGAPQTAAPILALMDDPEPFVRMVAGRALASLGAEEAMPGLLDQLNDSLIWIRSSAAEALGTLGAFSAVPALLEQLRSEDANLRRSVVVALMQIGSRDAIEALRKATRDEDWEVRVYAAEALQRIESEAR